MEMKLLSVLLAFIGLTIQSLSVSALRCAQCFSLIHKDCESGGIEPTPCDGRFRHAKFCVKFVGEYSLGTLIWRDCEVKNSVNNTCELLTIRNEKVMACYTTCSTDGCNGAAAVSFPSRNLLFIIAICVHGALWGNWRT